MRTAMRSAVTATTKRIAMSRSAATRYCEKGSAANGTDAPASAHREPPARSRLRVDLEPREHEGALALQKARLGRAARCRAEVDGDASERPGDWDTADRRRRERHLELALEARVRRALAGSA